LFSAGDKWPGRCLVALAARARRTALSGRAERAAQRGAGTQRVESRFVAGCECRSLTGSFREGFRIDAQRSQLAGKSLGLLLGFFALQSFSFGLILGLLGLLLGLSGLLFGLLGPLVGFLLEFPELQEGEESLAVGEPDHQF